MSVFTGKDMVVPSGQNMAVISGRTLRPNNFGIGRAFMRRMHTCILVVTLGPPATGAMQLASDEASVGSHDTQAQEADQVAAQGWRSISLMRPGGQLDSVH